MMNECCVDDDSVEEVKDIIEEETRGCFKRVKQRLRQLWCKGKKKGQSK
tara:strand:+ start:1364 stop:1510 length:147 start_codon:yes stop_codon:yes gene_type:complete